MDSLSEIIEGEVFGFRPRVVCACGDFKAGMPDYNCLWVECSNCGGFRFFRMDELVGLFPDGVPKRGFDG